MSEPTFPVRRTMVAAMLAAVLITGHPAAAAAAAAAAAGPVGDPVRMLAGMKDDELSLASPAGRALMDMVFERGSLDARSCLSSDGALEGGAMTCEYKAPNQEDGMVMVGVTGEPGRARIASVVAQDALPRARWRCRRTERRVAGRPVLRPAATGMPTTRRSAARNGCYRSVAPS